MICTAFTIATVQGPLVVAGYKTHEDSLLAIDARDGPDDWRVTFIPAGSSVNGLFPDRLDRDRLLARIFFLETTELAAWLSLTDMTFGEHTPRPVHYFAVECLKAAAKA